MKEREGGTGMDQLSVLLVRFKRRCRLWLKIAAADCLAPLQDRTAFLQLSALPIFLYLVFMVRGFRAMTNEIFSVAAATQALIYAVPIFVSWNLIAAAFETKSAEAAEGKWFQHFFVYNEPKLVFMTKVTNADNGQLKPFKIKYAEGGGYVYLNVEFDGFERRRIKAQVVHKTVLGHETPGPIPWDIVPNGPVNAACYIEKGKTLYLATECETQNWSIVKVYMTSFSIR